MYQNVPLKTTLAYLGILPFALFLLLGLFPSLPLKSDGQLLFVYYSVVIINFVAGSLWHLQGKAMGLSLPLLTNIISLLSFLCLLLPINISLMILLLSYICLLIAEKQLVTENPSASCLHYLTTRTRVTIIVITLHGIAFVINQTLPETT